MTQAQSQTHKLRLLRIFRVVAAAFKYCWKDAGRLLLVIWFACVLASVSRILLEWLIFSWPPRLPEWMLSNHFEPPTWLAAFVDTPWLAMGWAFVLNEMFHENPRRGIVKAPNLEFTWLRFELSRPILIAAAIFAVVNLIDGLTRFAQMQILVAAYVALDPSDFTLNIWAGLLTALRVALMAVAFVWFYPLAGQVLRTGTLSFAGTRRIMRGNWLRVGVIFILMSIILRAINRMAEPGANWLILSFTDATTWTWQAGLIRFVVDFPFQMLWIMSWAVIVGIVLHTLDPAPAAAERAGGPPAV